MPKVWQELSFRWILYLFLAALCVSVSIHYRTAHIHVRIRWVWLQQHLGQCSVEFKRIRWSGTAAHNFFTAAQQTGELNKHIFMTFQDGLYLKLLLCNTWVVQGVNITPAETTGLIDDCGASMLVVHSNNHNWPRLQLRKIILLFFRHWWFMSCFYSLCRHAYCLIRQYLGLCCHFVQPYVL